MSVSREKTRLTNSASRLPRLPPIGSPNTPSSSKLDNSRLRTYRRSEQMEGLLADILYVLSLYRGTMENGGERIANIHLIFKSQVHPSLFSNLISHPPPQLPLPPPFKSALWSLIYICKKVKVACYTDILKVITQQ